MQTYKLGVLYFICIFNSLNTVSAQENGTGLPDIFDIFEMLGLDPLEVLDNIGQLNTEAICDDIKNSVEDNLCTKQLKIVCENEEFMSRMLDAASKYPYSGILVRTRIDFGSYDECINLDLTQNRVRVIGKHCVGGLILPGSELNDTDFFEKAFKLSICIPDGCSANELMVYLNASSRVPLINDVSCSTKETWRTLGADDYAVLVFIVIIVLIMIISTVYDVYLYYTNRECPNMLFQAFSVYHNGKKLLQISKGSSDQIKVIHGLRVISMMWIIAGHDFATMVEYPGTNLDFLPNFQWSRKSTYITSAHLAVDTFFFLSGFLLAYQYLKQEPKPVKEQIKRIPFMYLHRYLRITPAVAAAYLIAITLLAHLGNGPLYYDGVKIEKDTCIKYWWSFFLYIQNYVNYDNICILNTWYLSADWQIFIISPIVFIPVATLIKRNFYWTMIHLFLLNIFLIVAPIAFKFLMQNNDNELETHVYLIDYFIGFMVGAFMREKNNLKYQFNAVRNLIMWIVVLLTMLSTLMVYKEIQLLIHYVDTSYYSYFIVLRAFWCVGLSWIIYSCHNGYGGFINWLLTTPMVQVLSKLTYCMYITHVCPVIYFRLTARFPLFYSQITGITDTIVAYFATVLVSVFWTLAFESPLIILEKYFLGSRS